MTTSRKSILIHCRRAPYGSSLAREAIDVALAAAAFDQTVTVLFSGDGVWQLLPDQRPQEIAAKSQERLLQSLSLYDVDTLYVAESDLHQRHLVAGQLALPAIPIDDRELGELIATADQVFSF